MSRKSDADVFKFRGDKLVGVWMRDEEPPAPQPAALFLHGFPGSEKNVDIARELLERGVASYRLHFRGAWGSEGTYSFSTLVEQARAGLDRLASLPGVDPSRLALLGFSFGGWTALHLAGNEKRLKAVVAIAPVGSEMGLWPAPEAEQRKRIAWLGRSLRTAAPGALYRDFAKAVRNDPEPSVRRIQAPLLLVHGTADEVVPCEVSKRLFAAANEPKALRLEPDAGHDFIDRREDLASFTAGWMADALVGKAMERSVLI
jgi:dipeptidyl aminopeptidase/acylaminoacyl peptidase